MNVTLLDDRPHFADQSAHSPIVASDVGTDIDENVAETPIDGYFAHCRHDILSQIPQRCRSVLSVGCGAGLTEAELVRTGARVVGIEMNPAAAAAARRRGLSVIEGDAVGAFAELAGERFDCLIYADVLEHLVDPAAVLQSHVRLLEPGGTVVISVPNFRYHAVARDLFLKGHVRYVDSGIFDRTHVRLTTRRMIEEWLDLAGLRCTRLDYRIAKRRERLLNAVSFGMLREFLARQVIAVAVKGAAGQENQVWSAEAGWTVSDTDTVRHAR